MALVTVEGIFRDGKVELAETPAGVDGETRVLEMFLSQDLRPSSTEEREALRQQAFARMQRGIPLGGPPYPRREELYDRDDGVERLAFVNSFLVAP